MSKVQHALPGAEIHTSIWLKKVLGEAPKNYFTFSWLIHHLPKRSFGIIFLFLGLITELPVISIPARLLVMALLLQVILGYHGPVLPHWIVKRRLPTRYLKRLNRHAVPALEHLEKVVRPRWPLVFYHTRRIIAFIALLLTILSLVAPVPLANMPVGALNVLMALAFIEHDGVLLTISLFCAILLLGIVSVAIAQTHLL